MTVEEEKAFLARHLKAAEAGEFVTIDALFQAYKKGVWMNAFLEELSQAYPFTRYGQCYMA